jgi:DNA polymerase-1
MNYQNIPRSDKVVKQAFIPKLDALLLCDYKNIEPRLLAFYLDSIGDPGLVNAIKAGEDVYESLARSALGIQGEITDEQRQVGKTVYLAMCYGGGTPTLERNLGISYTQARQILDRFRMAMPSMGKLNQALAETLQRRGYITTLYGRHLHPDPRKAINALVQGCAADVMKAALVRLDAALVEKESHMVSVIHDEVIFDCVEGELPWLAENVPVLMRDERVHSVVPIEVDVEVSRTTWAEKEKYV